MDLINLENLTIGSDPEFFVEKDGQIVSSIGIIPGTKGDVVNVNGFGILKDNVLVEGNIPPASNSLEFVNTMKLLKQTISDIFKVECVSKNSHDFKKSQLRNKYATTFGCEDYNLAWEGKTVCAADLSKYNTRTAGFHIHIGYELLKNDYINKEDLDKLIARAFDYFCIIPSRNHKPDAFRDENYGALGTYRNKVYGLEVRGLGGYFSKDEYLEWVYDRTIDTITFCSDRNNLDKLRDIKTPNFTLPEYKQLGIDLNKIKIK